jgi:hypothetical protein
MSSTAIIDQDLEHIAALLDRIELRCDAVCGVEGCVHHESQLAVAGAGTA